VSCKPAGPAPTPGAPPPSASAEYDKDMEIALWTAVKDRKPPEILQTYLDRFPAGTFAGLARVLIDQLKGGAVSRSGGDTRLASLPSASALPKPPEPPASDPAALTRALAAELKRVGCEPGALDGAWTPKLKQALRKFVRLSKIAVPTDAPSEVALQAVAGQKGRICPLECPRGEVEVNGRCVDARLPEAKSAARGGGQKTGIVPRICVQKVGLTFC